MEVIDNAAVRLRVPNSIASEVAKRIEQCEILGTHAHDSDLLMYWGQQEVETLTAFLDTLQPNRTLESPPSPILRDYNWPGIFKPFKHQIETAAFLSQRKRAFCFNEMGTGKSAASIWAADYLMNIGEIKRVLIICPLSIMYSAWQADVFNTAMHRSCGVAYGDRSKRLKVINGPYEFVIINYDGVSVIRDEITNAGFDLIIVDEANAYKTATTKRWKTLARIILPSTRMWMMTGTPASQSPIDAFGLARMISPYRVPKYVTAWRDKVMQQVTKFKWLPKQFAKDDVFYALQPAIRFTKKECLDLPDIVYQSRYIPLTTQVNTYYKKLKTQLLIEAAGEQVSAVNAAAAMSKLLQISGGAVYTDKHDVVEFDVSPRLQALLETLDETSNKVIVFVPFIHTIEVITKFLQSEGYSTEVIKGDVSAKGRAEIIRQFQSQENPRVLVIQPQAASHGVTLTAADTIVFWSPVVSVETFMQCVGRIERVGQVNKMTVVMLEGSEVEKKVYAMLTGKIDAHKSLVELYKSTLESEES